LHEVKFIIATHNIQSSGKFAKLGDSTMTLVNAGIFFAALHRYTAALSTVL
jgi:hypothetical protein